MTPWRQALRLRRKWCASLSTAWGRVLVQDRGGPQGVFIHFNRIEPCIAMLIFKHGSGKLKSPSSLRRSDELITTMWIVILARLFLEAPLAIETISSSTGPHESQYSDIGRRSFHKLYHIHALVLRNTHSASFYALYYH